MSSPFKVLSVVGTRPNFMKTAPVAVELVKRRHNFKHTLVHTGQHYDREMSQIFLDELGVGNPDHNLGVGSGSHALQTSRVMERLEPLVLEVDPDLILAPGDVNSTMAAVLVAAKLDVPIGHIEAGLRSFDRAMPEEINRIVTDALSDFLFTHSPEARENLLREGCEAERIHYVGNTMIDTLVAMRKKIEAAEAAKTLGLTNDDYLLVTLHRPTLVDGFLLTETMRVLSQIAAELPVVFPVHPRTRGSLDTLEVSVDDQRVRLLEPLGYLDFLSLLSEAAGVLTDSGGIQEEATFLGVPCFTLRNNTERPITVDLGTNTVLGLRPERIAEIPKLIEAARIRTADVPPLWDGKAAQRVVDVLESRLADTSSTTKVP